VRVFNNLFNVQEVIMKKISILLCSLLMAACASTPKIESSNTSASTKTTVAEKNSDADTQALTAAEVESKRLTAEKAELQALQKQSVYFDLDKFAIKGEYQQVVQKHAEYIKSHANDVVTLEGNADERGSQEYNLALGENRAASVKKGLEILGVAGNKVKTVSYGEEKPRLQCHEEKCWTENRRVDFSHKQN
jgi:peptidoglycan-associated lipoprotein